MNACGEFIISICSQIDLCILIYADTYARLCSFYRLQVIHQLRETNLKGSKLKDLIGERTTK